MSNRRRMFSEPPQEEIERYYAALRGFWHPVLPSEHLPDRQVLSVELLEEQLVLSRLNGKVVAMQDLCRHFQAQLSIGEFETVDGLDSIRCKYHGWRYNGNGKCVEIPQLLDGREIPIQAQVPTYLTAERYGMIWVCLEENPIFDIPEFPEYGDAQYRHGPLRTYEPWIASLPRVLMGGLDDTHFPWAHPGILGDRAHPEAPDHKVWRAGRYLMNEFSILQPDNPSLGGSGESGTLQAVNYRTSLAIPGVSRLEKDMPDGTKYRIWLGLCPSRWNRTHTFWRVLRNYDMDPAHDQGYEDFEDLPRQQDREVVESQRPWMLPPMWTKTALPLRREDAPLIELQNWLEELGISTQV